MSDKCTYYTMYPFFWSLLGLSGITKEVFAVLFAFWKGRRGPITVTYPMIRSMTGASKPSVASAIANLQKKGLIEIKKTAGLRSVYVIHLDDKILSDYDKAYGGKDSLPVKDFNHNGLNKLTAAGKESEPQNIKEKEKIISPLSISENFSITI